MDTFSELLAKNLTRSRGPTRQEVINIDFKIKHPAPMGAEEAQKYARLIRKRSHENN